MNNLLDKLNPDELTELTETLWRGWDRAITVHLADYYDCRTDVRAPIVDDLEATYQPVVNRFWGMQLGCRWQECGVCAHASCGFCPSCNPGGIAPNGEAYDTEDAS